MAKQNISSDQLISVILSGYDIESLWGDAKMTAIETSY